MVPGSLVRGLDGVEVLLSCNGLVVMFGRVALVLAFERMV